MLLGERGWKSIIMFHIQVLRLCLITAITGIMEASVFTPHSWHWDPTMVGCTSPLWRSLEFLGNLKKLLRSIAWGLREMGGKMGISWYSPWDLPLDFELQKGESLEISEQVMERYLCWVEFFLQIAFMQAFDIHAIRMNLVTGVYTQLISTLKHPWSNMFINIVVTRGSGTSVKRIFNTYPPIRVSKQNLSCFSMSRNGS